MSLFDQKIHWKSIWSQTGLLLHVPAAMAAVSLIICVIYQEWFALIPLISVAVFGFGVGQLLYRLFLKEENNAHLWDAMIIAANGWLMCSILAAVPFFWIATERLYAGVISDNLVIFSHPINALFEAFSGYTSTGLTMLQKTGPFPNTLYWWRSLLEWTGGLGLVVFILSLTHLNKMGFQLYYAEARTEQMSNNITQTAHWMWAIYVFYTGIAIFLFWLFGMTPWEAINHAFTALSTGGFALDQNSFANFSPLIQGTAIFMMILASMSFLVHFRLIRDKKWKILLKSQQTRLLIFFLLGGWLIVVGLNYWNETKIQWMSSFFDWTSALTTCGFSSTKLSTFSPMTKLFLIMGMFVGGATGSTCGGIKLRRLIYLLGGVMLRLKTLTQKKEKQITDHYRSTKDPLNSEPPGVDLPKTEQSERLYTAGVLFFLWTFSLLIGWFLILKWTPSGQALDALFEVTSAMSNVGLTSGLLTPEFSSFGKCIFMLMMWIGRLEIIPAIILLLSIPMTLKQKD
ncbi:MAG: TrkH family potassium uptake protein [Simkania sp.]|nr:TrkH family potassium uptake protein [Simkania sp.]